MENNKKFSKVKHSVGNSSNKINLHIENVFHMVEDL